ncbi:MAG: nuclear transport factor 2 family protein [Hyphomicrobiales bacterium]|nr:nuclear transport factor 2 family protein [Hyphomicrobiales bacterium]
MRPDGHELAIRLYAARSANDVEGVMGCLHPDASFEIAGTLPGGQPIPPLVGRDAIRARFHGLFPRWDWSDMRVQRLVLTADTVVAEVGGYMRETSSGQRFPTIICDILDLAEGRFIRVREYADTFLMARVAGLSI